jgi:predicted permease
MIQDLRFAFRLIFKEKWYTAVAVLALSLGIAVNATGFTIVNAAFIRGPAFNDSHELYMLSWQPRGRLRANISYPELQDLRGETRSFESIAAFTTSTMNISDDRAMPEQAEVAAVTANTFAVLRQQPQIGRDFATGEDRREAEPVVLLSYRLWKNRYAGDPSVLGSRLRINSASQPATIIGVMPDGMNFPINSDLWIPFVPTPAQEQRDSRPLIAVGRLRDGAGFRQAEAELNAIAQRLAAAYPDTNKELTGGRLETFTQRFVGGAARPVFIAIMGAASFVLLIACANVANLLLSRSAARAREMSVRTAIGASRWRVLRQLLLESVLLGFIGGTAGVLIALAGVRALDSLVTDSGKPYWIVFTMDYTVLSYVAAICVLTGILFGLAPALHLSKANLNDVMKQGGRGTAGRRQGRLFSGAMVVAEVALTIVLLAGGGLMIRSFLKLYTLDLGIRTENLMAMRIELPPARYSSPESRRAFFNQLEPRLAAIPRRLHFRSAPRQLASPALD